MKLIGEILIAVFLHPVAFILCLINIAGRTDMGPASKVLWGVVSVLWGIGPILYILLGGGSLF